MNHSDRIQALALEALYSSPSQDTVLRPVGFMLPFERQRTLGQAPAKAKMASERKPAPRLQECEELALAAEPGTGSHWREAFGPCAGRSNRRRD